MDDAELLVRWRGGDVSAGEELFERYFDPMYRFFRTKAPDHCEELVQRTFATCVEKREALRDAGSFRAFLYGVARFELLRLLRARDRAERQIDLSKASVHDLDPSPSRIAANKQEQRLLLEALRRIPIDLQIVVELHYWEDLSTAEIAHVVEIPHGTVKSRLRRARDALAAALVSLEHDPSVLHSTTANLDAWVADVKHLLDPDE